jgi:hypothetical protein
VQELRCGNGIKFGEVAPAFIEVKCRSRRCGHAPGVLVIHRFTHEGDLLETRRFRDATELGKETGDAADSNPSALRSA